MNNIVKKLKYHKGEGIALI